jgi:predicted DNA-binding WGR domain protein
VVEKNGTNCYFWTRYGRQGDRGVTSKDLVASIAAGEKEFNKTVKAKCRKGYQPLKIKLGKKEEVK